MCGIGGIIWDKSALSHQDILQEGVLSMSHRGPDSAGLYIDELLGLIHTRLSIVDTAGGRQPFCPPDHSQILIFNGEIFNYLELREDIKKKFSYKFITESDTEVLYAVLLTYGIKGIKILNGQFSFAFYDPSKKKILLARDSFGEKPLYYSHNTTFCFGSELKLISTLSNKALDLDPIQLNGISDLWSTLPNRSVCTGINALPPGHYLEWEDGAIQVNSYVDTHIGHGEETSNSLEIREYVHNAVSRRMTGDAPVGLFLSGGLDSAIVSYEATKLSGQNHKSFSVSFENKNFDESFYQNQLSSFLGTDHHSLMVTDKDIVDNFEAAMFYAESPSPRSAFIPMFLLCKEVKKNNIKVVLSGEGADEVFYGYDIFRECLVKSLIQNGESFFSLKNIIRKLNVFDNSLNIDEKFLALKFANYQKLSRLNEPLSSHISRSSLGALTHNFVNKSYESCKPDWAAYFHKKYSFFENLSELERSAVIETESLLSGHLLCTQGDRISMACGVETRAPFLDLNLVKKIQSYKVSDLCNQYESEKFILKNAYKGLLPDSIINRTKFPYRSPDSLAFTSKYGFEYVMDVINSRLNSSSIFNLAKFKNYCEKILSGNIISPRENHAFMVIFSGIIFEKSFSGALDYDKRLLVLFDTRRTNYGLINYFNWNTKIQTSL